MNNSNEFEVKRKRPEDIYGDVTAYYDYNEISRYAESKSLMNIQEKITIRALELLDFSKKKAQFLKQKREDYF